MSKFVEPRPCADLEAAARTIMEIANGLGDVWDGRLFTKKLNWPMLHDFGASPAEWRAGVDRAASRTAGSGCTRAARITASRKQAKTCSREGRHGRHYQAGGTPVRTSQATKAFLLSGSFAAPSGGPHVCEAILPDASKVNEAPTTLSLVTYEIAAPPSDGRRSSRSDAG